MKRTWLWLGHARRHGIRGRLLARAVTAAPAPVVDPAPPGSAGRRRPDSARVRSIPARMPIRTTPWAPPVESGRRCVPLHRLPVRLSDPAGEPEQAGRRLPRGRVGRRADAEEPPPHDRRQRRRRPSSCSGAPTARRERPRSASATRRQARQDRAWLLVRLRRRRASSARGASLRAPAGRARSTTTRAARRRAARSTR